MDRKNFIYSSIVFALIYFFSINGLVALPNLSVNFLLKEVMGLTATQAAYFGAITLLAWVIKPVWGLISDYLPIFGYRRKSYLILMSVLASFSWFVLALTNSYSVFFLLLIITVSYIAYAFQDAVTDGLMVETGKPYNLTGRFQAIQWAAVYLASIITALIGGYVAELARQGIISYQSIFAATAVFPLITAIAVYFFAKEEKFGYLKTGANNHNNGLKEFLKKKDLWLLAFFLFFWNFSPSIGTPFFYYSIDTLKFDGSFLGIVGAVSGIGSLIGAVIFEKYLSEFSVRKLLVAAVFFGIVATFFDLIYFTPYTVSHLNFARNVVLFSGLPIAAIGAVIFLSVLNLAAKVSPVYAGGTVFAFLTSFSNLGSMGSQFLGGYLFSIVGFVPLILISAGFSFLVLFILPYLPVNEDLTFSEKLAKRFINPIVRFSFAKKPIE